MSSFTITQTPKAKFAYLYPEDNGCDINCFPFGDTPNYKCVDDAYNSLTPDETYVFMDGVSTVSEVYEIENHGTLTGTINYVKGCCRAKSDQYPPAYNFDYKVILSEDSGCGNFAASRIMPLSTGFTTFENAWSENPFTSAAWTWDEIDVLQVGFQASSPSVVINPIVMIPLGAGDTTDITDVTTGYEHWEAVQADRPLTEVSEDGAAWQYDLYNYVLFDTDNYTTECTGIQKFGDYVITTSREVGGYTYIYRWNNGQLEYLAKVAARGYCMTSDGNGHYFIGGSFVVHVLEYDDTNNTLNLIQDMDFLEGGEVAYKILYKDGYLYVPTHKNLRVYSVNSETGKLTEVLTDTSDAASVDTDGTYIYTTTTSGGDFIKAYHPFDGTDLTEIDSIAILEGNSVLSCSGVAGEIFCPDSNSGLKAYSFDGTNLALEDTLDNGGRYWLSACDNGYIYCFVDDGVGGRDIFAYSYDGASLTHLDDYVDVTTDTYYFSATDGFVFISGGANDTGIVLTFNGAFNKIYDIYDCMTPKYIDDNIESVSVVVKMGKEYDADDEADIRGRAVVKTHGIEYPMDDYWTLEYPKKWYSHTWTENPNTSAAWTLEEVQLLQAGIGLYGSGSKYAACSVCHVVIAASSVISPEIHTSKSYLKINYTPPTSSCSLIRPEEISYDHTRNVNMLNFWNGNREVYDLSRNNKTMVLTGMEYGSESCDRILCVRNMGLDGSVVTLSELGFAEFNGKFRIRSFGWDKISDKPLHYKWILELEDSEL